MAEYMAHHGLWPIFWFAAIGLCAIHAVFKESPYQCPYEDELTCERCPVCGKKHQR